MSGNKATGNGGNPGNGGNGGGIYIDGANNTVNLDGIKLSITKAPHMVAAYSCYLQRRDNNN